ncbi:MAG: DUF2069 domain-containing protein [Candidatus Competibacterales bacterium]
MIVALSRLTVVNYFALLALLTAWVTVLEPHPRLPVAVVLLGFVAPLLLPLWGVVHRRPRSYVWTMMLGLYYFLWGVGDVTADHNSLLAWGELLLSIALFVTSFGYLYCCYPRRSSSSPKAS